MKPECFYETTMPHSYDGAKPPLRFAILPTPHLRTGCYVFPDAVFRPRRVLANFTH